MSATVAPLVSLVAAVARNGVIGRDNGLAWVGERSVATMLSARVSWPMNQAESGE